MRTVFSIIKHSIRITVFLCCALFFVKAQSVFNNVYVQNRPLMLFSSIVVEDTCYRVIGTTSNMSAPYFQQALVSTINNAGLMEKYKAAPDDTEANTGIFWNNLKEIGEDKLGFVGYGYDTVPYTVFCGYNSILDIVVIHKYYAANSYSYQGRTFLKYDSNTFYLAGVRNINLSNNSNVMLMRLDSNGNRLWEKYYDQRASDFAQSIILLANGNLLLGCVRNDLNQTHEHANTWLLEVDTGGTVIRQWFDPNDSTYVAEGILQTQDGGFIYAAQKKSYQSVNDVYKTATIVKLDSNFNKQWVFNSDTICPEGFRDIEILPDGSYIACGSKTYRYAWVVKLSATGQKLWSKEYVGIPDWGSDNYLTDIDVLPDGSLIAVGQCQFLGHTPPQVGWFLKLDSNGCEVENCTVGISEIEGATPQISIYPNPASGSVQVQIGNEMFGGELKVYDIQGKLLLQKAIETEQIQLNISSLAKGMYLIIAEKQGKSARTKLIIN